MENIAVYQMRFENIDEKTREHVEKFLAEIMKIHELAVNNKHYFKLNIPLSLSEGVDGAYLLGVDFDVYRTRIYSIENAGKCSKLYMMTVYGLPIEILYRFSDKILGKLKRIYKILEKIDLFATYTDEPITLKITKHDINEIEFKARIVMKRGSLFPELKANIYFYKDRRFIINITYYETNEYSFYFHYGEGYKPTSLYNIDPKYVETIYNVLRIVHEIYREYINILDVLVYLCIYYSK